jgi:anion-transporting  ArsA/GET3 family ATPase
LRLLRTPRQLLKMVPGGPIASTARHIAALLENPESCAVLLVSVADEMAVNETIEARAALQGLSMRLTRPVLNRIFPRRFTADQARAILSFGADGADPLLAAARLQIRARRDAERHLRRLQSAFGVPPIPLRQVCSEALEPAELDRLGRDLLRGLNRTEH